jgi:hypothetical protein
VVLSEKPFAKRDLRVWLLYPDVAPLGPRAYAMAKVER